MVHYDMVSEEIERAKLDLSRAQYELRSKQIEAQIEDAKASRALEWKQFQFEKSQPWYKASLPWLAPTLGALVAIGTIFLNQHFERESRDKAAKLESETLRFNRESQIILQATDGVSEAQAVKNLEFYLEAGFIEDESGLIATMIANAEAPVTNAPEEGNYVPCNWGDVTIKNDLSISDHRFEHTAQCESPNTASVPLIGGSAKYIVINYSAGGSLRASVGSIQNKQSKRSTHIVIGRDGRIVQFVPFNMKAWHAGRSEFDGLQSLNKYSIGIELVNWGWVVDRGDSIWKSHVGTNITDAQNVEITDPLSGKKTMMGWQKYTEAQLSALIEVLSALSKEYNIPPERIVGQADVNSTKLGPGPLLPWDRIRSSIRAK